MPVGAPDAYSSSSVRAVSNVMPASPVPEAQASPAPEASAQPPAGNDRGGVVVSISPEAEALAQADPPKERGAPQPDMSLTRALDGVQMERQEESEPAPAAEAQTRTTDPMVIAQAVMAS